jgi:protein arginine kinase activator
MKCEKCQKGATVHVTNIVNNQKEEIHLCEDCAKKHNTEVGHLLNKYVDPNDNDKIAKVTAEQSIVMEQINKMAQDILKEISIGCSPTPREMRVCTKCGMTLRDFVKTGKFGCPNDYEVFKEDLKPIIQRLQGGSTQHIGKIPTKSPIRIKKQIEMLEVEMESSIKSENYERAAQIRDQISRLQKS